MQRIHFTTTDLTKIRLATTLGPNAETVFAWELLGSGRGASRTGQRFRNWQRLVVRQLRARRTTLAPLVDAGGLDGLRWLLEHEVSALSGQPPGPLLDARRRRIVEAVDELGDVAVRPYWHDISRHLHREHDARGRIATNRGVELMLATLHPLLRWNSPVLEIADRPHEDIALAGRGLLLTPSMFLAGKSSVLLRADSDKPAVLAFSTPPDADWADALGSSPGGEARALGALVGQTRAAALRLLIDSRTTSELAQRLNISLAGVSQHTAVLRQAGLITTRRNRNVVLHTVTPLGIALLDGDALPATAGAHR